MCVHTFYVMNNELLTSHYSGNSQAVTDLIPQTNRIDLNLSASDNSE